MPTSQEIISNPDSFIGYEFTMESKPEYGVCKVIGFDLRMGGLPMFQVGNDMGHIQLNADQISEQVPVQS